MNVEIERFALLPEGTLGQLTAGDFQCFTLERPWLENQKNISCIPDGEYECKPFTGKKFKGVVEITDVKNRSYILFHSANWVRQLEGCIAPGVYFQFDGVEPTVRNSKHALKELFRHAGYDFTLTIKSKSATLDG